MRTLSRRQFASLAAGTPVALSGCGSRSGNPARVSGDARLAEVTLYNEAGARTAVDVQVTRLSSGKTVVSDQVELPADGDHTFDGLENGEHRIRVSALENDAVHEFSIDGDHSLSVWIYQDRVEFAMMAV